MKRIESPVLLVATKNRGKVKEILAYLAGLPFAVKALDDLAPLPDCEEDGQTFLENSRKKCAFYYQRTGLPTLADDSGLCVDALQGLPGVFSARYAGPDASDRERIEKLLAEMADVPDPRRTASFVCALTFQWGKEQVFSCQKQASGYILREPRGQKGFGYDPIFLYPEAHASFAELAPELKNRVSHRGQALACFRQFLMEMTSGTAESLENSRDLGHN